LFSEGHLLSNIPPHGLLGLGAEWIRYFGRMVMLKEQKPVEKSHVSKLQRLSRINVNIFQL